MKIGFIGLGNVGSKLAGSLLRSGFDLSVRDIDPTVARPLLENGANWADSPKALAEVADLIITCLPNPAICAAVMGAEDGVLQGLSEGKIWAEMSTTDEAEVKRIGALVSEKGGFPVDCPVSGGCHRAANGNISIFVGCERDVFERVLPVIKAMGRCAQGSDQLFSHS
jgi:3-hydroxyisobutyrate dehydrogenase